VLLHAESGYGGLVYVRALRDQNVVEYIVADCGIGIPNSLRQAFPRHGSDCDMIELSLQEGVTRDQHIGAGNGLFGSYRVAVLADGHFEIASGTAQARYLSTRHTDAKHNSARGGMQFRGELDVVPGTIVRAGINLSKPDVLAAALTFGGRLHTPHDFIEKYEENLEDNAGRIPFRMLDHTKYFGTRESGRQVRIKIENLLRMTSADGLTIDMNGVFLIASSFADELFGRLSSAIGMKRFEQLIRFENLDCTVKHLIDRAIRQRDELRPAGQKS
jgi:hypothetical protein